MFLSVTESNALVEMHQTWPPPQATPVGISGNKYEQRSFERSEALVGNEAEEKVLSFATVSFTLINPI